MIKFNNKHKYLFGDIKNNVGLIKIELNSSEYI